MHRFPAYAPSSRVLRECTHRLVKLFVARGWYLQGRMCPSRVQLFLIASVSRAKGHNARNAQECNRLKYYVQDQSIESQLNVKQSLNQAEED